MTDPETLTDRVATVDEVVEHMSTDDGTGIVIVLRLDTGQRVPLHFSQDLADQMQLACVRGSAQAAKVRRERGIDPPVGERLPGAPIVSTGFRVLGAQDGASALLVAEGTGDRIPPIVLAAELLPKLLTDLRDTERSMSRHRRRSAH